MADQLANAVPARRRPQRTLTPQELDIVRRVDLLTLHKSLLLGLVDPVPNPSPMSEEEGTWVREHAMTQEFHVIDRGYPWGFWRWSMCERGTCWNCLSKRCDLCVHRQQGGPTVDSNTAWVSNHRGRVVARLIERPGGEPCVWWCRCPCPKTGPMAGPERSRKEAAAASPDPVAACVAPAHQGQAGQLDLFGGAS